MTSDLDEPGSSPHGVDPDGSARVHDVAEYIADLTAQLARLARSKDLELIAYLLEMARLEAATTARRLAVPS